MRELILSKNFQNVLLNFGEKTYFVYFARIKLRKFTRKTIFMSPYFFRVILDFANGQFFAKVTFREM